MSVDELHTKDIRLREGGGDVGIELRSVDRGCASILGRYVSMFGSVSRHPTSNWFRRGRLQASVVSWQQVCSWTYLSKGTEQLSCKGRQ